MASQLESELKTLYETEWDNIRSVRSRIADGQPHGPFLIGFVETFASQPIKLMVIGKQTNGWPCDDDIKKQMANHRKFHKSREFCGKPIHNVSRKMEKALNITEYSCAYGNFNRFDVQYEGGCGEPRGRDKKAVAELDALLIEEISILKPDVCIFFTGPEFDDRLVKLGVRQSFVIDRSIWPVHELCRLNHDKLPCNTFRTYHPEFLRRRNYEGEFLAFVTRTVNGGSSC